MPEEQLENSNFEKKVLSADTRSRELSRFRFLTAVYGCPMFAPAYMGDNDFFKCFHSIVTRILATVCLPA